MELSIDHLTFNQVQMLNRIWSFRTQEEYTEWVETLSPARAVEADCLVRLLQIESADVEDSVDEFAEANAVLSKFRLGAL